jgi:hypothetical protein
MDDLDRTKGISIDCRNWLNIIWLNGSIYENNEYQPDQGKNPACY